MDHVRRRPWAGIVAAATLVLTHTDVTPPRPDNSPIVAGGEPVDTRLQQVYTQAPLGLPSAPGADQWGQFGQTRRSPSPRPSRARMTWS